MYRLLIPLVGILTATYFASNAAIQMSGTATAITAMDVFTAPDPAQSDSAAEPPRPDKAKNDRRPVELVHKSLIRFLTDIDDLLDSIHDPASFAAVKPKLLHRAREQKAYAAEHSGQGLSLMTKAGAKELEKAMNRHAESLERAIQVAPGVKRFFDKDLAAILNAK
jgi:hypothetical protein